METASLIKKENVKRQPISPEMAEEIDRLPEWIRLFQDLVRERSVFEAEHGIVELVAQRILSRGVEVARVPHHKERLENLPSAQRPFSELRDRSSLVARVPGSGGGRSLVLNAPLDIVSEGNESTWTYPPFEARIDRGRLYGRGAVDDKAGVTIALAVLDLLVDYGQPLRGDVLFQFVLEDETTGNGTLLCLADGHVADAALIIDGTRSTRAIERQVGGASGAITVRGRPVSISVSHVGMNAIEVLAELLLHLRSVVFRLNERRDESWSQFPSPYQLITSRIAGGSESQTLPETACAEVCLTFPAPASVASMRELLEREVRGFAEARDVNVPELEWLPIAFEPVAGGAPLLNLTLQNVARELGMPKIDIGPSTGWSDMRHFASFGVPCLLYGPGEGYNPHRADEYYETADLPRMIDFFYRFVKQWCA